MEAGDEGINFGGDLAIDFFFKVGKVVVVGDTGAFADVDDRPI